MIPVRQIHSEPIIPVLPGYMWPYAANEGRKCFLQDYDSENFNTTDPRVKEIRLDIPVSFTKAAFQITILAHVIPSEKPDIHTESNTVLRFWQVSLFLSLTHSLLPTAAQNG